MMAAEYGLDPRGMLEGWTRRFYLLMVQKRNERIERMREGREEDRARAGDKTLTGLFRPLGYMG